MQHEAMLKQLGYTPNEALLAQIARIEKNTPGYEKISKHIMDLHDHLKVNKAYVSMSNSNDYFKIKLADVSEEETQEAKEKIEHFQDKFKVNLEKVKGTKTFYIKGFNKA